MKKIYDSDNQQRAIYVWKKRGLICKENESYKDIYYHVMSINNCNLCNIKFNDKNYSEKRCMDHCHVTGYFRNVLCHRCNSTIDSRIPHLWISLLMNKKKGKIYVYFNYHRKGFKTKQSPSLTKLLCLSFINLLKVPI